MSWPGATPASTCGRFRRRASFEPVGAQRLSALQPDQVVRLPALAHERDLDGPYLQEEGGRRDREQLGLVSRRYFPEEPAAFERHPENECGVELELVLTDITLEDLRIHLHDLLRRRP